MRKAIILHGPPCVGKSTIAGLLQSRIHGSGFVNLDSYWGPTEQRGRGGLCRYADLQGHQARVLIIELGLGEPENMTPGATRQANEWVQILRNDGRKVFPFLLWMNWEDATKRMLDRASREQSPLYKFSWETASYAWYEHKHNLTTFPSIPDFEEERIITTDRTPDEISIEIMQKVNEPQAD